MGSFRLLLFAAVGAHVAAWGLLATLGVQNPYALAGTTTLVLLVTLTVCSRILSQRVNELKRDIQESAREQTEAAMRSKSEFLANLGTDLRQPLSRVLEMADLAIETDLTPRQREYLASLRLAAESLQELLDDIIDLSCVEAGRLEVEREPFALRETIEELVGTFRLGAQTKGLGISFHIQSRVPNGLLGDKQRLRQVLMNLISNSIKYTQRGEVVIRVAVKTRVEQRVELEFRVTDTGIGIPPDRLESLFLLPHPSEAASSRSGIGLAISAQLVKLLRGRIGVDSELGKGSTFFFTATFPITDDSGPETRRTQLGLIPDLPVLVAEHDPHARKELEDMLTRWETRPLCVASTDEVFPALENARRKGSPFGLVIVSHWLPGMDGFALCRQIKHDQIHAATPVAIMLPEGRSELEAQACDAGADAQLLSPIKSSRLARTIVTAVLGQGRYQQLRKDLGAAEMYVRSLIPPPTEMPLRIDWRYVPAADLAGDALGFHWIDEQHCAFYLLDVTGHGLDAALLSVSILNVLKSMTLPETDFRRPDQVLAQLNDRFPMESHGDRCFSIWYGVYNSSQATLTWSGGAHPPALLIQHEGEQHVVKQLPSSGPLMGMLSGSEFPALQCEIRPGMLLYVYSDAAFEVEKVDGTQWSFSEFVEFMTCPPPQNESQMDALWKHARDLHGKGAFDDDFTLLEVTF